MSRTGEVRNGVVKRGQCKALCGLGMALFGLVMA
jgi:hypothetical protein